MTNDRTNEIEERLKIAKESPNTVRIDLLNQLAWKIRDTDTKRALGLSREAFWLSQGLSYQKGLGYSLRNEGYCNCLLANHQLALTKSAEALHLFEEMNDKEGQAAVLNTIGNSYHTMGEYGKSLEAHLRSLDLCEKLKDSYGQARSLNNIGNVYERLNDFAKALEYYYKSVKIKEDIKDLAGEKASLNNIGLIYEELGDYENALDCYLKSLQIEERVLDRNGTVLMNLGNLYRRLNDFKNAMDYHSKSLAIRQETADREGEAECLINIGEVHECLGDFERAKDSYLKSLKITLEIGNRFDEAAVLKNLGVLFTKQRRLDDAFDHLRDALLIAEEIRSKELIYQSHKALSEAYEAAGDLTKALEHFKLFHRVKEEVFNEEADKKTKSLMIEFEVDKTQKEKEIYRLRNVELAKAYDDLRNSHKALHEVNDQKSRLLDQLRQQAEDLERQAKEDGLTGLFNRRYFDTRLSVEFKRAKRFNRDLTLVLADLDHFKLVNDQFSHQVGDEVLKAVAQIIKNSCRTIDVVARYGGEEFVLLLPETTSNKALILCEKIRRSIEQNSWEKVQRGLKVSISIGLSDDLSVSNYGKLISLADQKLYEAKQGGRNQVRS